MKRIQTRVRIVARMMLAAIVFGLAGPGHTADLAWLDDPDAVRQFVDGVMAAQIASGHVVGATVSIVHGKDIVLAKGYGVADLGTDRPVSGTDTLFRIGSVSKLFVWVAVMQQVAAGRLDLNADVNTYLKDLQIPDSYPEPITLTNLMTHTAGFEDRPVLGMFARGPQTVGDFHSNLIAMLPRRMMMPGKFAAYSNYGAALAANLVEIVSDEDWDDYVESHITKPLAMTTTTTRQPVPDTLVEQVSKGYLREGGHNVTAQFEFVTLPPAGSVSSTAVDMARFMMELLAHGDTAVLSSAARAALFEPGYQHDPRLNRMRHGMYELSSHGAQLVGHSGDTIAFHSILTLCPELDLGIFASYNNEPGEKQRDELVVAFLDRLFGRPPRPQSTAGQSIDAARYGGFFTSLRVPYSGHDKILSLLGTFQVKIDSDGQHLLLPGDEGPRRFVNVDTDLFESEDGRERVAFRGNGPQAMYLFPDSAPPVDFVRVAPRDNPLIHIALIATVTILGAAAWLVWPFSWLRHRGRIALRGETRATLLVVLTAASIIAFGVVIGTAADPRELVYGLPQSVEQALWIPVVLIPLSLLQLLYASRAWIGGWWWVTRRIHYTLLTFATIAFVVWAFYWHLTAVIIDF